MTLVGAALALAGKHFTIITDKTLTGGNEHEKNDCSDHLDHIVCRTFALAETVDLSSITTRADFLLEAVQQEIANRHIRKVCGSPSRLILVGKDIPADRMISLHVQGLHVDGYIHLRDSGEET
jgi:hypothetical protein